MRQVKNFFNWIYWNTIGEITISGIFNEKIVMISLKRGELHRLYVGHKGVVESLTVNTGTVDTEEFNYIKSIYEQP